MMKTEDTMKDTTHTDKPEENMDEPDALDNAFHEMEMLYKSRCVDVPLTSNVKVVEIDEEKKEEQHDNQE